MSFSSFSKARLSRRTFGFGASAIAALPVAASIKQVAFSGRDFTSIDDRIERLSAEIEQTANFQSKMQGHIRATEGKLDQRFPTALAHRQMFTDKIRRLAIELKPLTPVNHHQADVREQALQTARGFLAVV